MLYDYPFHIILLLFEVSQPVVILAHIATLVQNVTQVYTNGMFIRLK